MWTISIDVIQNDTAEIFFGGQKVGLSKIQGKKEMMCVIKSFHNNAF